MKEGWTYKRLGDICDILDSKRKPITKKNRIPGDIPYFGATGILDHVRDFIFDEKLVLLGEDGAKWGAGESSAYIISGKSWVNNHAHALRPRREIVIDEYLIYYLNFSDLSESITGVTVPKLNQEKMRAIEIPVPSLSEQERIVSYLDAQFAKIDALKANTDKQLKAAKDLFLLQFKQAIENTGRSEYYTLGEICTSINGLWKGKKPPYINVGVIRNANFTKEFTLNFSNIEYLDVEVKQFKTRKLRRGDLIVEKSGGSEKQPVGRTILFDAEGDFSISNFTSILRINDNNVVRPKFLYLYMLYAYKEGITKGMQNATTGIHNIIYDKFLAIQIPALSIEKQEEIINSSEKLIDKVALLQKNYDQTITLCNDLKHKLLKSIFE